MQRESKEDQAAYLYERIARLRSARHPRTERTTASIERQVASQLAGVGNGGAGGGLCDGWIVGPLRTALHVGKVVPQRCDAALGKPISRSGHVLVRHAGPCPMRKNED